MKREMRLYAPYSRDNVCVLRLWSLLSEMGDLVVQSRVESGMVDIAEHMAAEPFANMRRIRKGVDSFTFHAMPGLSKRLLNMLCECVERQGGG